LLAQQELALLLLHAFLDVLADGLGDVELGQVITAPLQQLLEPLGDVAGLQQPDLLLVAEVRGVAGEVGEGGRVVHLLDRVDHLPRAALLEDRGDQPPVLAGQFVGAVVGR
jgi:hypothetical protein